MDAEQRDAAAGNHVVDHLVQRHRAAGHLQADVEALRHAEFLVPDFGEVFLRDVHRAGGAEFFRQFQPSVIDVRDHDLACAGVFCHCDGHATDRAGPGDQHILADHIE